jgi:glycosyltransferase involved in cell wall biosynthesis
MTAKRLLFVSPRFLFPSDSGGKIRTRDILRGMKGGRFEITLVSPEPPGGAQEFAEELRRVCDRFVGWRAAHGLVRTLRRCMAIVSSLPIPVAGDREEVGCRAVAAELALEPDVVVADFPHASVLFPPGDRHGSLLFTHNVESEIFRRHAEVARNFPLKVLWRTQAQKMQLFEEEAARRFDGVVAVSERDAAYFSGIVGEERVFAIPTGVDLDYFTYRRVKAAVPAGGGSIVFCGSMDWLANVDGARFFMDEVWPRVANARPTAKMVVVGHSPPRELVQAAVDRGLSWTFTGFVDDIREYVRTADVYVIPLRVGGGTRIKAFQAMAMGCPVVSTSLGIEGLPVVHDEHCLVGDSAEDFATAVLHLLDRADVRKQLSVNARRLVDQRFGASVAAAAFEQACLHTLSAPRCADSPMTPQPIAI